MGSYGKQLGHIGDALAVLIRHVKLEDLDTGERDALTALRFQLEEIAQIKTRYRSDSKLATEAKP